MASRDGSSSKDSRSADAIARDAVRVIFETLCAPFERGEGGPGQWWIVAARVYQFRGPVTSRRMEEGPIEVVKPRVAGWRRDRLPVLPDTDVIDKSPDWICEVEDPRFMHGSVLGLHEVAGVPHAWTVDPVAMKLLVYARQRARWLEPRVYGAKARVRIPPFEAIEIDVSTLWRTT